MEESEGASKDKDCRRCPIGLPEKSTSNDMKQTEKVIVIKSAFKNVRESLSSKSPQGSQRPFYREDLTRKWKNRKEQARTKTVDDAQSASQRRVQGMT
ncbi:hypothetical protein BgiMline_031789 [Biomphalaria glabrata]